MVVAGGIVTAVSAGTLANVGGALIGAGVGGLTVGITGVVTLSKGKDFNVDDSWKQWGISTGTGLVAGALTGGSSLLFLLTPLVINDLIQQETTYCVHQDRNVSFARALEGKVLWRVSQG